MRKPLSRIPYLKTTAIEQWPKTKRQLIEFWRNYDLNYVLDHTDLDYVILPLICVMQCNTRIMREPSRHLFVQSQQQKH